MNINGASSIQIGKIDPGRFRNKLEGINDLGWAYLNDTKQFKWKGLMKNVYYKRQEFAELQVNETDVVDDGKKNLAVFDSFYPGIHLPIKEWVKLYQLEQKVLEK